MVLQLDEETQELIATWKGPDEITTCKVTYDIHVTDLTSKEQHFLDHKETTFILKNAVPCNEYVVQVIAKIINSSDGISETKTIDSKRKKYVHTFYCTKWYFIYKIVPFR